MVPNSTACLGLMLQNQYCFSIFDIISNVSAKHGDFCYRAEKGPYEHPTHFGAKRLSSAFTFIFEQREGTI